MRLEVPCYEQEEPWSCLAACVRMCLAAAGDSRSEGEWRALIGTSQQGTALCNTCTRLSNAGLDVDLVASGSLDTLMDSLADSRPVIIGIMSGSVRGRMVTHAVVVTGILDGKVIGNDPAVGTETTWEWEDLDGQWSFAGGRGLVMPAI